MNVPQREAAHNFYRVVAQPGDDDSVMFVIDREVIQAPHDARKGNTVRNHHRLSVGRGLLGSYLAPCHSNQYQPTQHSGYYR